MRAISDQVILKCLASYVAFGYFGKSFTPLTSSEREHVVNTLIARNLLDDKMIVTKNGRELVRNNLKLFDVI